MSQIAILGEDAVSFTIKYGLRTTVLERCLLKRSSDRNFTLKCSLWQFEFGVRVGIHVSETFVAFDLRVYYYEP